MRRIMACWRCSDEAGGSVLVRGLRCIVGRVQVTLVKGYTWVFLRYPASSLFKMLN